MAAIGVGIAVVAFATTFVAVYFCQKRREKMLDEKVYKETTVSAG